MRTPNLIINVKKIIFSLVILFTGASVLANNSWITAIDGTEDYWVKDVTTDHDGNMYAIGGFEEYLFIEDQKFKGKDGLNIFFAKFNPSGKLLWFKQYDGTGNIWAERITTNKDGHVYMAIEYEKAITVEDHKLEAAFSNNLAVVKFDETGTTRWVKDISGKGNKRISSLALDPVGNVYIGGSFEDILVAEGRTLEAEGVEDAFILKLNDKARLKWMKHINSTKNAEVYGIAIGTDLVSVTGTFTGKLKLDDRKLESTDNNFDAWVAAFNLNGTLKWVQQPMGSHDEIPTVIAVDNANNVIISGSFQLNMNFGTDEIRSFNDTDVFLAKYDEKGNFKWVEQGLGNVRHDLANGLVTDNNDNIFLIGSYKSSITFDDVGLVGPSNVNGPVAESVYIIKCTADGKVTKGKHLGSVDAVRFNVVHRSLSDNIFIVGHFDEFVEDTGNIDRQVGNTNNPTIYIWKTQDNNGLFRSENSVE